jgi:Uma2 family endonuclease
MATVVQQRATGYDTIGQLPPLENGDRLSRDEFERRYSAMPNVKKAELIEGVVHVPSPAKRDHSTPQFRFVSWLGAYEAYTPGVEGGDNGSVRLDLDNEPQPDGFLRIFETHGGQSRIDSEGYVAGVPELVGEVSLSRVSVDLHSKLQVYRRNGVQEYVVWRVRDRQWDWFVLRSGQFDRLAPSAKGIYKSEVFPGLWLDAPALLRGDARAVLTTLPPTRCLRQAACFSRGQAAVARCPSSGDFSPAR